MRYFRTLLWLRLKADVRSAGFLVTAASVLALSFTLSAVLPKETGVSLRVGVIAEGTVAEETMRLFAENGDYEVLPYEGREALERDVMNGRLHCGYLLGDGAEPPVTVLETKGSYMRLLIDELVLAARYEARVPLMAEDCLREHGAGAADARADYERLGGSEPPLSIRLETVGGAGAAELARESVQPLLYAVLVSVFIAASLLAASLRGEAEERSGRQLMAFSGHPLATAAAPPLAGVLLNAGVLLAADWVIGRFSGAALYGLGARMAMIAALAAFTAVAAPLAGRLRRYAGAVAAALPPALLVSVICSGAVVNPEWLPARLGVLRFLSPAWYALRLLNAW